MFDTDLKSSEAILYEAKRIHHAIPNGYPPFENCNDLYDLFKIEKGKHISDNEISTIVDKFSKKYRKMSSAPDIKNFSILINNVTPLKNLLTIHKEQYDNHIFENSDGVKKLKSFFSAYTEHDHELDSNEIKNLYETGRKFDLNKSKVKELIGKWITESEVKITIIENPNGRGNFRSWSGLFIILVLFVLVKTLINNTTGDNTTGDNTTGDNTTVDWTGHNGATIIEILDQAADCQEKQDYDCVIENAHLVLSIEPENERAKFFLETANNRRKTMFNNTIEHENSHDIQLNIISECYVEQDFDCVIESSKKLLLLVNPDTELADYLRTIPAEIVKELLGQAYECERIQDFDCVMEKVWSIFSLDPSNKKASELRQATKKYQESLLQKIEVN